VLAERLEVEEEADDAVPARGGGGEPARVLLGRQRPLAPVPRAEAEADVVGEAERPQEQADPGRAAHPMDAVGARAPKQRVRALAEDAREPHRRRAPRDVAREDQLGVAQRRRAPAEERLHPLRVRAHLALELAPRLEAGERVVRRLRQELDGARRREPLEALEGLGRPALHLGERGAADRERAAEAPLRAPDHAQEGVARGHVAARGDAAEDPRVLGVVEPGLRATAPDLERAEAPQPERLVHLEVGDDRDHAAVSS
jgi:hypothetical protein